jgi:hypothetical protein
VELARRITEQAALSRAGASRTPIASLDPQPAATPADRAGASVDAPSLDDLPVERPRAPRRLEMSA